MLLASKVYGGSCLVQRVHGKSNPLREQILAQKSVKALREQFYVLENVQMRRDQPEFVDIWIHTQDVKDAEARRTLDDLHNLTALNISNWQSQMLYPYTHNFVLFDDIKNSLNGFGRFIEFRCIVKNRLGQHDPTFSSKKENWISSVKEGHFLKGVPDGYQRQLIGFNGHCKQGFFKDGQPYGKYVEYDLNG
mmetsp:Transcript_11178/g.18792  ORF Transcript_11178/g.18792 Transcript_11178/m.18792 type:complete len:192 (+) Transcript_11178:174-749(+)